MFGSMFPLSTDETQLSNIEPSWADCANGFRTGVRIRRELNAALGQRLLDLHELLDVHRKDYESGDASALLWALSVCLHENLPAPYWCADGVLKRIDQVTKEPCSLHDLFGLSKRYPANGKKAENTRKREGQAFELWWRVWEYKAANNSASKDAAINNVRKKHFQYISQRTAWILFDRIEDKQAAYRKALGMRFGGLKF